METKTGWVKRRRGKKVLVIGDIAQFGKWDFPRLDYSFSRILFFFSRREEGRARPDVEMDGQQRVALAACCIQSSSTVPRLQCCDLWPLCCYRRVNLVKRKCFLTSGAGHGSWPILAESTQRWDLKGCNQQRQFLSASVQIFNVVYSSLRGFIIKQLQRL